MANNRMWLVHKPTGKRSLLAKHFGAEWKEYTGPRHEPYYSVQGLFNVTSGTTDFVLEFEHD